MAKQTFIPSTIYQISYMSFTIPVMTRKIGIESTISQMIPPKNILINTGSPQHTAIIITAPKELSWYAETHSVMAHNDKSAWKANPNKMPRYFKNNTGWSICWESTIQDIFSNPFKPYIIQHKTKLTNTNHMKMKIVNVKEAKILAGTSFLLPSSVLKINGSIFVWLSSAKMVDTPQIINMLPKINPNWSISTNTFHPVVYAK